MKEMMHLIMKPIDEVDNVQIGDVMVNRVGFKDVESALVTLKSSVKQRSIDVPPLL